MIAAPDGCLDYFGHCSRRAHLVEGLDIDSLANRSQGKVVAAQSVVQGGGHLRRDTQEEPLSLIHI